MILTLTPNPSIDRTVSLAGELMRGQVQRVDSVTSQGGGKGVNISRASVSAGQPTLAVLPAAKDDPFVIELLAAGIDCRPVRPAGDVRVNITITEPDGTTTKLNSPGATVEQVHLDAMSDALMARAGSADWAVLAGSLPPGAPPEFYADVVRRLRGTVAKVAVDTSEAPLRALVDALPGVGTAPDEAQRRGARLLHRRRRRGAGGRPAAGRGRRADARRPRRARPSWRPSAATAPCSSPREGAWHATPPPTTVVSTVGAGDSSLFGYVLGDIRGLTPPKRLALAVAYGSAAAALPGTTIPEPSHLRTELVTVTALGGTA